MQMQSRAWSSLARGLAPRFAGGAPSAPIPPLQSAGIYTGSACLLARQDGGFGHGGFIDSIRIGGVVIPNHKRVEHALQSIHGIGRARTHQILSELSLENKVTKDLSKEEIITLCEGIAKYMIEGDLVGSIAAGGRYDNLVGSIIPGKIVPTVGVSLGIERVFVVMQEKQKEKKKQEVCATEMEVLLSILGKDLVSADELASELWSAEIKAEFKLTPRVQDHIRFMTQSGIPWMVLVSESEMRGGTIKLKDIRARREEEEVPRKDFAQALKQRLNN